ncbi:MAG: sigma-70 family RNA polymerase sigma factor, partial [Thermoanaerobaculia bacterium]|nr:sigma-70 family RNA polymerase sigma factor [Thermoanaerobaculia bacterium]
MSVWAFTNFEELYRSHYRLVRSFFRKRGLSDDECLDLTQDTFLGAHRGYHRYRGDANPRTWLLAIAGNLWINWLRDSTAAKRAASVVALDAAPDGGEALVASSLVADGPNDPL